MLDAHLHLCDDSIFASAPLFIQEALDADVSEFLNVVTNELELTRALELQKLYPMIKIAASTTPHEAIHKTDHFYNIVAQMAREKKIQAIGETGLEYFHEGLDKDLQLEYLTRYLDLAKKTKLPLVFHCRDGFSDLFSLLENYKGHVRGMIHCFTGSYEEAIQAINLGLFISISGIVTFKKSTELQQSVSKLPLESLLIETDSPYLAPLSQRGKINKPIYIKETFDKVAQLKSISFKELETSIEANFFKFFDCQ
jgi:TatD DNase family protein